MSPGLELEYIFARGLLGCRPPGVGRGIYRGRGG
jgi:hypothetical protein